jgi:hypothetical protein
MTRGNPDLGVGGETVVAKASWQVPVSRPSQQIVMSLVLLGPDDDEQWELFAASLRLSLQ